MSLQEWNDCTREILQRLDIRAEYESMGVTVAASNESEQGYLKCHAGPDDRNPSAGINVAGDYPALGRYKEFTGLHQSLGFFQYCVERAKRFTKWSEARNYYAQKTGVKLPGGKSPKAPEDDLTWNDWNQLAVSSWCRTRQPTTVHALKANGGKFGYWPRSKEFSIIALPAYGPHGIDADPVGYTIWNITGQPLKVPQGKGHAPREEKMLSTGGSKAGWIGRWALANIESAKVIWKVEGPGDMLALASIIPPELIREHVVLSNSNGTSETPDDNLLQVLMGKEDVRTLHDADLDGLFGSMRWTRCIGKHVGTDDIGKSRVRQYRLPVRNLMKHGADVRDFISGKIAVCKHCDGSGNANGEWHDYNRLTEASRQSWDLRMFQTGAESDCKECSGFGYVKSNNKPLTYSQFCELFTGPSVATKPSSQVEESATLNVLITTNSSGEHHYEREKLAEFGCNVLGHDQDGTIILSNGLSRYETDVNKITYLDLLKWFGNIVREKVHVGAETIPGVHKLSDVKEWIAVISRERLIRDRDTRGIGCWRVVDVDGNEMDEIIINNGTEIAVWRNEKVEMIEHLAYQGIIVDAQTRDKWVKIDLLAKYLEQSKRTDWCTEVITEATSLFKNWFWKVSVDDIIPVVAAGLVLSTWVQTIWEWRPHVAITGPSDSGKSTLFDTVQTLFGDLALASSKSTEAGIRQAIGNTASVLICDEFEHDKHRQQILELLRTSSRGDQVLRGTTDQEGTAFGLRHIAWVAAIEVGLNDEADRNRFILLETVRPPADRRGLLSIPSRSELADLGTKLLAIAIRHAISAKKLSDRLKGFKCKGVHGRVIESYSVPVAMLMVAQGKQDTDLPEALMDHILTSMNLERQGVSDEHDLLQAIFASHIDLGGGDRPSVSQVLSEYSSRPLAYQGLEKCGVGIVYDRAGPRSAMDITTGVDYKLLFIAHDIARRFLLRGTPWEGKSIEQYLKRVPGAAECRRRIGGALKYGISIPMGYIMSEYLGSELQDPTPRNDYMSVDPDNGKATQVNPLDL